MKKLTFSTHVYCYIGEQPLTLDEYSLLVNFNVRTGTINARNMHRMQELIGKTVYIWPVSSHRSVLDFQPRKGKLIDKGRGNFALKVEE